LAIRPDKAQPVEVRITIANYDAQWPQQYEAERKRLMEVIGRRVIAIEHVGSTAVPGLAAKPIIDIMVAVRQLGDARVCVAPLESIGYQYVPVTENEIPDRLFFHRFVNRVRTHHVHITPLNSPFWDSHLLFRGTLRANPLIARDYEALKRRLAVEYGDDRLGYTYAKTDFIEGVLARARAAGVL
jgi:GrpB-like predicted nucleotidyltransferase (UPF0157 family)